MKAARILMFAGTTLALAACADQNPTAVQQQHAPAPLLAARSGGIDGAYIVVVKEGAGHGWADLAKDMNVMADWFDQYLKK